MTLIHRRAYNALSELERVMQVMMVAALPTVDGEITTQNNAIPLAVDVTSDENNILVRAALPGFKEDEVDLDVQGKVLTITAESKSAREDKQGNWHVREIRFGKFMRSIPLPEEVATDKADAALENGILTVKLPKKQSSPLQKIEVKSKSEDQSG